MNRPGCRRGGRRAKQQVPARPSRQGSCQQSVAGDAVREKNNHPQHQDHHRQREAKGRQLNGGVGLGRTKGQPEHAFKKYGRQLRTEQQHKKDHHRRAKELRQAMTDAADANNDGQNG